MRERELRERIAAIVYAEAEPILGTLGPRAVDLYRRLQYFTWQSFGELRDQVNGQQHWENEPGPKRGRGRLDDLLMHALGDLFEVRLIEASRRDDWTKVYRRVDLAERERCRREQQQENVAKYVADYVGAHIEAIFPTADATLPA